MALTTQQLKVAKVQLAAVARQPTQGRAPMMQSVDRDDQVELQ